MDDFTPLHEIPLPSTEILDVTLGDRGGMIRIEFELPTRKEVVERGLLFDGVRAYRQRAESHCTAWHIEAYDTLGEVNPSSWVDELRSAMPEDMRDLFDMHHYMIYLDSVGCYEVVASSWALVSDDSAASG